MQRDRHARLVDRARRQVHAVDQEEMQRHGRRGGPGRPNRPPRSRIQTTTVYTGVYRVTTPAGTFNAALIRTDYQIDVLGLVSVKDTLYTFYAEGVGKVAEAEHRQISAAVFTTDTRTGKVLVFFTPQSPPARIEAP